MNGKRGGVPALIRRLTRGRYSWVVTLIVVTLAALFLREPSGREGADGARRGQPVPAAIEGRARVIDGDSLRVGRHEIRLQGIDAPEGRQDCRRQGARWACGERATTRLRQLTARGVNCRPLKRDQHGRVLAICKDRAGDVINARLVREGWAVAFGKRYRREEGQAKAAKRGLWAGSFERPRAWRRQNM
ncbi:MAG: thermonuclease family protein [Pseudomonadota bacterium]